MSPLHVLHVLPSLDPSLGGPAAALEPMCRALQRTGEVQPTIVAGSPTAEGARGGAIRRVADGLEYVLFPLPKQPKLRRLEMTPAFLAWLVRHAPGFDLVHTHGIFTVASTAADLARRTLRRPFVMRPCGALDTWSLAQGSRLKRPYVDVLTRPCLRAAAFVHCTSRSEADAVGAVEPLARREVIPHGLELSNLADANAPPPERPYLLFLSRLHHKKGLDLLLPAFARIAERLPSLDLVVAGPDEGMLDPVRQTARKLGLDARVKTPGAVFGDAKRALLAGASAFVLPSYQENFGIAALEAAAAGLPLVVTPGVALHTEIESAGAGVVSAADPGALATALEQALGPRRETYAVAARSLAARYSLESTASRLLHLYREAVTRRPS